MAGEVGPATLPTSVRLVEVLPRDGFQRLPDFVATDEKVRLIDKISATGIDELEFTSFTHPDAVPNLRDADAVTDRIDRADDVAYRALVPNVTGMERAIEANVDKVNALVTVSETYTRRNQNRTVEEVLEDLERIVELAAEAGITVEAGIGTSFYCPYEGAIPAEETISVVDRARNAGVDQVTLATTMGLADPVQVSERLGTVIDRWPALDPGIHLHNTNGMALANALAAMICGVERFDASLCGLGGGVVLPDDMAGVGNVPTEDLLYLLTTMGVTTTPTFESIEDVAMTVRETLGLDVPSHVLKGGTRNRVLDDIGTG